MTDVEGLHGRNKLLHELIKFLTQKDTTRKIVTLQGESGSGKYQIGMFAILYCMDRKYFSDGAMNIKSLNFKTCLELFVEMSDQLKLLSHDENDIIKKLTNMNLVIIIFDCE